MRPVVNWLKRAERNSRGSILLTIRSFRNSDSPALLHIWDQRARLNPEHFRPLSPDLLEQHVLGRLYFDRRGLLLAFDDDQPVGFAHAAFGPNPDHTDIDRSTGVVCMMMVLPEYEHRLTAGKELLKACERYLTERGARLIYGGAIRPVAPFYMGLYGGSEPIGVFESDTLAVELYRNSGYETINKTLLFRVSLKSYKIPITPKTVPWRRKISLTRTDLPKPEHWWEACMMCHFAWLELQGYFPHDPEPAGSVVIRVTDSREMPDFKLPPPTSSDSWMIFHKRPRTAGLMNIRVREDCRNKGLSSYLLGEMIREAQKEGVTTFEAQAAEDNAPLVTLLRSMRWNVVDRGEVFRKNY